MKSPESESAAGEVNRAAAPWAVRVLPLQGGRNFRDLGGYLTVDGRRVRWGRLYRSGSMAGLTQADCEYLSGLGIRLICDLRTSSEREAMPSPWRDADGRRYWSRDYAMSFGDLRGLLKSSPPTAEQVRETMLSAYRQLPFEQAPAYRELLKRLAGGELPMVFNCTAGKDRTGIIAALILDVLGVPREVILDDYALTNELLAGHRFSSGGKPSLLSHLSPDVIRAVMGSDPAYLRTAFAVIEERHGCIAHYLRDVLDIGEQDLNSIRRELLE
ncbi:MAG: protein tyrosine/serine phosphatase [Hydrocarboniphaga sp.]|uniref:tyrosine-protein phosphatase n=1 Tax=Hydrocarboniphaga sp. TaxID=2033016 RepID=UPI00261CEE6C|nr:tyrosine-protein phosphatase [Hydrocarboniphaga sp.]MDB5968703.1 protein tyrosine/serine phosphatase [Hydrocarboniphaga sp.]